MVKKFLIGFGIVAIILTITPYIPVDYWWIRMFDFPHTQLTMLTSIAILVYLIKFDVKNSKDYAFISVLIFCCGYQFVKIYPYTPLATVEVFDSSAESHQKLKIFTANVLQENEKSHLLIQEIETLNPDIILLTEVNKRWLKSLHSTINKAYAFKYEIPLENAYGMALYSKLELVNPTTKFLVADSIPSIHTKALLKSGDVIQLYAIHPTPPVPQENMMSTDRDAEMMMVAKMSLASELPVIVFGDFNDVAWSVTSKLFANVSGLLDARIGRGMFNTYSARSYILKWPLDHIFISSEFRVQKIEVRDDIFSDHYPLYTEFTYEPKKSSEQKPEAASAEDLAFANDQIENFLEQKKNN
ncbi:endonuclease/exonuclease/phosphatase family protein [uncultured Polaribacter sp.]|uniref:endonuclease/exonuclease/phosphatase family protein n=1 Tax=uncultured Polaribacter sp. TaxID=174711 RepID=UPI0026097AC6|nr:endonuclease/exonuclease/phosphatase family protein [uncultured Polaribacter sp.]